MTPLSLTRRMELVLINQLLAKLTAWIFERMNRYDDWLQELPEEEDE